jgi:hypothetical protein
MHRLICARKLLLSGTASAITTTAAADNAVDNATHTMQQLQLNNTIPMSKPLATIHMYINHQPGTFATAPTAQPASAQLPAVQRHPKGLLQQLAATRAVSTAYQLQANSDAALRCAWWQLALAAACQHTRLTQQQLQKQGLSHAARKHSRAVLCCDTACASQEIRQVLLFQPINSH